MSKLSLIDLKSMLHFKTLFFLKVESSQSMIRIVGLSATLPNYIDVARFLNVNPHKGLFYFDGRFRPVPLQQTFIGVKSSGFLNQMKDMEEICYEKALENVQQGHQVSFFYINSHITEYSTYIASSFFYS